jgi:hypothetical protein
MSNLFLLYRNILENSTITVSNENASFPKWRLHDRDVGKLFKGTASTDHQIIADQGGYITNKDMELNANWAPFGTPSICERSSTQKHGGTYSWKFRNDAISEGVYYSTFFPVVAGKTYRFGAWVYPDDNTSIIVGVTHGDDVGWAYLATHSGLIQDVWNYISGTWVETITGSEAHIAFLTSQAGAATYYVDDVDVMSNYDVDTLIIAAGHNLRYSNTDMYWWYSDDCVAWYNMVVPWKATEGQTVKEAAGSVNKRYWTLYAATLAAIPEIPELFMGLKVQLTDAMANPAPKTGLKGNVDRVDSLSGRPFFLVQGEDRQYRNYSCILQGASLKTDLESFLTHSRGKPFWLKDIDGTWLYMSLVDPNIGPLEMSPRGDYWRLNLEMIQVLP